jgi:DNA-binding NarL/FixJ family response regulator
MAERNGGGSPLKETCVRVLVVDDYQDWRHFVASTLQRTGEFEIVHQACDGVEAVQQAKQLRPDLILLDIGLPGLNGLDAARQILEGSPNCKILFVSENRSTDIVEAALDTGACGYVLKSDAGADLLPGIRSALEGKRFTSASLAGHFLVAFVTAVHAATHLPWFFTLISGIN